MATRRAACSANHLRHYCVKWDVQTSESAGARCLRVFILPSLSVCFCLSSPSVYPLGFIPPNRSARCFLRKRLLGRQEAKCQSRCMLHNPSFSGQDSRTAQAGDCITSLECTFHRAADEPLTCSLVWQPHKRGIHFLPGCFRRGVTSTRGKQSSTECET